MAGGKIYIEPVLSELLSGITNDVSLLSEKMAALKTASEEQVIAINSLKTIIGSSTDGLNITAANDDITLDLVTSTGTYYGKNNWATINSFGKGSIRLKYKIYGAGGGSYPWVFSYSINGAAEVTISGSPGAYNSSTGWPMKESYIDIPVNNGDIIKFYAQGNPAYINYAKITYGIFDISKSGTNPVIKA